MISLDPTLMVNAKQYLIQLGGGGNWNQYKCYIDIDGKEHEVTYWGRGDIRIETMKLINVRFLGYKNNDENR